MKKIIILNFNIHTNFGFFWPFHYITTQQSKFILTLFFIKKRTLIIIFSPFFSVGNYVFKYFFRFNLCHFVIYKSLKRSSSLWKFKKKTWFRGFVFLLLKKTSHDTFVTTPYIHASLYIQCYIVVSVLGKHWFLL